MPSTLPYKKHWRFGSSRCLIMCICRRYDNKPVVNPFWGRTWLGVRIEILIDYVTMPNFVNQIFWSSGFGKKERKQCTFSVALVKFLFGHIFVLLSISSYMDSLVRSIFNTRGSAPLRMHYSPIGIVVWLGGYSGPSTRVASWYTNYVWDWCCTWQ